MGINNTIINNIANAIKGLITAHNSSNSAHSNLFYTKTEIDNLICDLEEDMLS